MVLSGGVFQNQLLLTDTQAILAAGHLAIWTNHEVPPNDGGISLGQRRSPPSEPLAMHELSIAMSIVEMAEEENRNGEEACESTRFTSSWVRFRAWLRKRLTRPGLASEQTN